MKKMYKKPVIEVEKLLIESLMQGHSYNRPQSKESGWGSDGHTVITNGQYDNGGQGSNNLWED